MAGPSQRTVSRLALASVVANAAIVVTGGAVRLTASGLGCPTWPRCTATTYTPTSEYAAHGVIEFTNRLLTFVLTAVVVATLVAVVRQRPRRRSLVRLAGLVLLGIPAQAVLGGITVLTGLNPWTVMAHFLLSMVLIGLAVLLHVRTREGDGPALSVVKEPFRRLSQLLLGVVAVTLAVGTVVTGSGPHSGDVKAGRTGFDPASVSQLHADLVMLLIGLSVATWIALKATDAPAETVRAAAALLGVEVGQAAIGWTQYFTHLPVVLVGAHLAGACLVLVAACRLVLATRVHAVPVGVPAQDAQLATV
ncbi:MAG: COX15/CtaA family protein [Actinobacteria bacterium]|nr:COX15/CtaA family protein [Actinomycetota bacterium]MCA1720461.1 COX15/CtaA family protein [Actinomycetota bacterium]